MLCLNCDTNLVKRNRVNAASNRIVYSYNYCEKCGRSFDEERNEIVLIGDKYILKKNTNDPDDLEGL